MSLDRYVQALPKMVLGTIVVVGTLVFAIISDPPKTICDIQLETVGTSLRKGFFWVDREEDVSYGMRVKDAFEFCLKSNSPGGCHTFFEKLDVLGKRLKTLPKQCGSHNLVQQLKVWHETGLALFVKIGWGDEPPESAYQKRAWLDDADLALFCRLKRQYIRLHGKEAWGQFQEATMLSLPKAKTLQRDVVWRKCLFSMPCRQYF